MGPLAGLTVVAIEQAVAAPFATRQLADLGARVIKVERPDGGDFARGYDTTVHGLSSYFVWLNRSKQSLTLNLKRPEAGPVLQRLLERADVFVQNLAPGAADRLGVATAELRATYPRLIVCTVSGYGSTGPYAMQKAYDLLVQAECGLLSITGSAGYPARVGVSVADIAAGMYAYAGILTALVARGSTGRGTSVEVSLFDSLAEWMQQPAYFTAYGGSPPPLSGAHHASIAPYGPFRTGDGGEIFVAVQNSREWERFCSIVLGQPSLAADERYSTNAARVRNRSALHTAIDAAFATVSTAELIARLAAAGIACARMNSVADFVSHPQLGARACWREVGTQAGAVRALVPPARIEGTDPVMNDVPALGAHTGAILHELGIEPGTVDVWRKEGIV